MKLNLKNLPNKLKSYWKSFHITKHFHVISPKKINKPKSLLTRQLEFEPAYDKRDPDPRKNYGIHGVNMRWILKGKLGAVQFLLYTNWQLPEVREEYGSTIEKVSRFLLEPLPADIGYHSRVPLYAGQSPVRKITNIRREKINVNGEELEMPVIDKEFEPAACMYLGGKDPCFYDGSGLNAARYFDELCRYGDEALWQKMESYYYSTLGVELKYFNFFWIFKTTDNQWFYLYRHYNGFWEKSACYDTWYKAFYQKLLTLFKMYRKKFVKFIKSINLKLTH